MGIKAFDNKGKDAGTERMRQFDGLIEYSKSAKEYYEKDFSVVSYTELGNVIWYAEQLREHIKREHPEITL